MYLLITHVGNQEIHYERASFNEIVELVQEIPYDVLEALVLKYSKFAEEYFYEDITSELLKEI